MPTDPKHLPPRDCLVLTEQFFSSPTWCEVHYIRRVDTASGEDEWWEQYGLTAIDPSRVITWRELPEVE